MNKLNKLKFTLFTNNLRSINCFKYLKKKKIKINNIVLAKKNLNPKVFKIFYRSKNVHFISNLKNKKLFKILGNTDLGLICGFPYIFKKEHLALPKYGFINLHAGTLPKYRGGSPLNWQILNNEKFFGISSIKINNKIDGGDIICQKKFRLLKKYNIENLHKIANDHFPKMLYESIFKIISNSKLKKQNSKLSKYYKQRNERDSLIVPKSITYEKLILFLRATSTLYPRPYFFDDKNSKIIIRKIKIVKNKLDPKIFKNRNVYYYNKKKYLKLKNKIIIIN